MRICEVCQKPADHTTYLEILVTPVIRNSGLSRAESEMLLESVGCKPTYASPKLGTADVCGPCSVALGTEITVAISEKIKEAHDVVLEIVDRVRGCIKNKIPDNTVEFNRVAMEDPHQRRR